MRCEACGSDNRAVRKFCPQCGASLARACPACGATNLPGERFCGECGKLLDAPPAAPAQGAPAATTPPTARPSAAAAAERRLVSVLFADLVGSTAIAEG